MHSMPPLRFHPYPIYALCAREDIHRLFPF